MSLSVGSAVLLSDLITCLRERHTATWEKIKIELCATDAEFDRTFEEVIGRKPQVKPQMVKRCRHGGVFRGETCNNCNELVL